MTLSLFRSSRSTSVVFPLDVSPEITSRNGASKKGSVRIANVFVLRQHVFVCECDVVRVVSCQEARTLEAVAAFSVAWNAVSPFGEGARKRSRVYILPPPFPPLLLKTRLKVNRIVQRKVEVRSQCFYYLRMRQQSTINRNR